MSIHKEISFGSETCNIILATNGCDYNAEQHGF